MTNLWSFLLQTLEVSWTALFLLILKRLLADKLSPRWQYGVWGVLFLRLLIPAGAFGRYLLTFPAAALQTAKETAEASLSSVFCDPFSPVRVSIGIPWLSGAPKSATDWLFVLYLAGVLFCLARYFLSYVFLRLLLRRGRPVSERQQKQITDVCSRYGLTPCRAVILNGIPSAFVCGLFSPVLVLPEKGADDKILLHELLHLHSMDAFQSILWSVCRSIHWCNPFLQYVFNRIGNDMESLCDQRVLELLEGEERRKYGEILLDMTNDRYPRAPGTTSLSNGGRNIRRRIVAITRFQKYPKGTALVSVCITLTLLPALLTGISTMPLPSGDTFPSSFNTAGAHLVRCTTAAGAVDTYAKGLMAQNSAWLTAASPSQEQTQVDELIQELRQKNLSFNGDYYLYNPVPCKGGRWQALLVFPTSCLYDENGMPEMVYNQERSAEETAWGYHVFPVTIFQENKNRWVVAAEDGHQQFLTEDTFPPCRYGSEDLPSFQTEVEGETGTFLASLQLIYTIQPETASGGNSSFFESINAGGTTFLPPNRNAEFSWAFYYQTFQWTAKDQSAVSASCSKVRMNVSFPDAYTADYEVDENPGAPAWNGTLLTGGGSSFGGTITEPELPPSADFRITIFFDNVLQESVTLHGKEWLYENENLCS